MTDAKTILDLIESVDPNDTAALDEIDARVWWWLSPKEHKWFEGFDDYFKGSRNQKYNRYDAQYTKSRDALKILRNYIKELRVFSNGKTKRDEWVSFMELYSFSGCFTYDTYASEELAELHVIIEAIAYERGQQ